MTKFLSGIKAISFDVDGTLWDFDEALIRGLTGALDELRSVNKVAAERLSVDELDKIWERERDTQQGHITDLFQLRRDSMRRALNEIGSPDDDLADRMADAYFEARNKNNRPFDDVVPALEALYGKYKLGLLTNGNMHPERLGLQKYFEFRVLSVEHGGIEKPDPRIFEITLREAGCQPHELAHVGDHLEYDVMGANDSGVRSVWLNRKTESRYLDVEPDVEVETMGELAAMVELAG